MTKTDVDHQEAAVNQSVLDLLASPRKRFYPLQGYWNHSILVLSKQGKQHTEDNDLPSKTPHPQCHWEHVKPDHFWQDLQRMDRGWLPSVLTSILMHYALHRTRSQIWFPHHAITNLFFITESGRLSNKLCIYSMAGTRSKNIVKPAALDNKQLKNMLENEIKISKQEMANSPVWVWVWKGRWKTKTRHAPLHGNILCEGTLHTK